MTLHQLLPILEVRPTPSASTNEHEASLQCCTDPETLMPDYAVGQAWLNVNISERCQTRLRNVHPLVVSLYVLILCHQRDPMPSRNVCEVSGVRASCRWWGTPTSTSRAWPSS